MSIALAAALFLAGQPASEPQKGPDAPAPAAAAQAKTEQPSEAGAKPAAPEDAPWPSGVPHDDYLLVSWCYGALRGFMDLHDQVMPEVTRIESSFREPGRTLAEDLKVYDDEMAQAKTDLKRFEAAMTAAEKASLKPINQLGGKEVEKGHSIWLPGPGVTKAQLAQAWMSWSLPARCQTTAPVLLQKATLLGATFKVNEEAAVEPEAKPVDTPATTVEAKPTEAPTEAKSADAAPAPTDAKPAQAAAPPEAKPAEPQCTASQIRKSRSVFGGRKPLGCTLPKKN